MNQNNIDTQADNEKKTDFFNDSVPEVETDDDNITSNESSPVLHSYMERLADAPLLEPAIEQQLWEKLFEIHQDIRRLLASFGRTYLHFTAMLGKNLSRDALFDLFPQSMLMDTKAQEKMYKTSSELCIQLSQIHESMYAAYASRNFAQMEKLRKKGAELLTKYPFLFEIILAEVNENRKHYLLLASEENEMIRHELNAEYLCTPDEFKKISDQIEALMLKLDHERNRLVNGYLRLVVSIAKHYHTRVPLIDLIQEGNLGLVKAIDKFDYKLGHRFSTYASWWIKQSICHAVGRQSRIIRLPLHMLTTIHRINKAEQQLLQEKGVEAQPEEIAERLGMTREKVNSLKRMAMQSISLQAPVFSWNSGKDVLVEDTVNDFHDENDPMHSLAKKILAQKLQEILDTLPKRTREILACRFGLDGATVMSLNEMSRHFKISRERIRQIENSALAKMRAPETISKLEDYFI